MCVYLTLFSPQNIIIFSICLARFRKLQALIYVCLSLVTKFACCLPSTFQFMIQAYCIMVPLLQHSPHNSNSLSGNFGSFTFRFSISLFYPAVFSCTVT